MVHVNIELWPHGFAARKHGLGLVRISNVGGTTTRGNYQVLFFDRRGRMIRDAEVKGFPRKRLNALHLLARALEAGGYLR